MTVSYHDIYKLNRVKKRSTKKYEYVYYKYYLGRWYKIAPRLIPKYDKYVLLQNLKKKKVVMKSKNEPKKLPRKPTKKATNPKPLPRRPTTGGRKRKPIPEYPGELEKIMGF